jgi:Na+/proline symporter
MQHVSPIITALFIAALASALMSTSDSSILAGASVVTENFLPFFKPNIDGKEKLRWTRIMVVVIGIISITIALLAGTIYHLAMVAWSILLVGLFAPFAFGIYWKKANRTGAIASFFGGLISWIILTIFFYIRTTNEACGGDFDCAFWDAVYIASTPAFVVSVLTIIIVSLATQKSDVPRPATDVDGNPLSMKNLLGLINIKKAFGNRGDEPEPKEGAAPAD